MVHLVLIHTREKIALFFRKTNGFFRIAYFFLKKDTVFLKKTPFLEITQFFFSKKLQSNKAEKSMFLQKLCFFYKIACFFLSCGRGLNQKLEIYCFAFYFKNDDKKYVVTLA